MAADIREIIRAGAAIGLSLNVDKCELITHYVMSVVLLWRVGAFLQIRIQLLQLVQHATGEQVHCRAKSGTRVNFPRRFSLIATRSFRSKSA